MQSYILTYSRLVEGEPFDSPRLTAGRVLNLCVRGTPPSDNREEFRCPQHKEQFKPGRVNGFNASDNAKQEGSGKYS